MGRKRIKRNLKKIIYIAIEDQNTNKTEKNYLHYLGRQFENCKIKLVRSNSTSPVQLVNALYKEVSREEGTYGVCIFDGDLNKQKDIQIKEAIFLGEKYGLKVILSTPCIELWFFLHFDYTTAYLTNDDSIKLLRKYIKDYDKNFDNYELLNNLQNMAIKNAINLEIFHKQNGAKIMSVNTNPYTNMNCLVEFLDEINE